MWWVFKANKSFCDTVKMPIPRKHRTPPRKDPPNLWQNQPPPFDLFTESVETLAEKVRAQAEQWGFFEIRILTEEERVAGLREVIMILIKFWQKHPKKENRPCFHAAPSLLTPTAPIRFLDVCNDVEEIIAVLRNPMSTANKAEFQRCAPPHTKTFGAPCLNEAFHTLVQNEARQHEKLTAFMELMLDSDFPELQGKVNLGDSYSFFWGAPASHRQLEEIAEKYDQTGVDPDGGWFPVDRKKDPLNLCGRIMAVRIRPGCWGGWFPETAHEVKHVPKEMIEYGFYLGFWLKRTTEEQNHRDEIFKKLCGKTELGHIEYMIKHGTRAEVWPSTKAAPCVNKAHYTFQRACMLALMASLHPYWDWEKDENGNWVPKQKPPAPEDNYAPFPFTITGRRNIGIIPGGNIQVDANNRVITRGLGQDQAVHFDCVPKTRVAQKRASIIHRQPFCQNRLYDELVAKMWQELGKGKEAAYGQGKGKEAAEGGADITVGWVHTPPHQSPPPSSPRLTITKTVVHQVKKTQVSVLTIITDPETGESSRTEKTTTTTEESVSRSRMVGSSSKDSQAAAISPLMPSLKASKLIKKKDRIRRRRGDPQNMARLMALQGRLLWIPKKKK